MTEPGYYGSARDPAKASQWRADLGNAAGLFGLSLLLGAVYVASLVAVSGRADERAALLTRLNEARAGRSAERLVEGVVVALPGQALPVSAGIPGWSPSLVASQSERRRESQLGMSRRSS